MKEIISKNKPVTITLGICAVAMIAVFNAGGIFNNITDGIQRIEGNQIKLTSDVEEVMRNVDEVSDSLNDMKRDQWNGRHQQVWAEEMEMMNMGNIMVPSVRKIQDGTFKPGQGH